MSRERVERKLAAILAADVAGYSRLMGADEEAALMAFAILYHPLENRSILSILDIFDGCRPLPSSTKIHVISVG
jgi:hypothetical protein